MGLGWKHVVMIICALAFVVACGYSPACGANIDKVYMIGASIVTGVFALVQGVNGNGKAKE